jgi:hypothetical protein
MSDLGIYTGVNTGTQTVSNNGTNIGIANGTVGQFYDTQIPTANLLSYIDMGNRACYPVGSSLTTARDLTTSVSGLTIENSPIFDTSNKGCLQFTRVSLQRLYTPTTQLGNASSNYTFGCWYQAVLDGGGDDNAFSRGNDSPSFGWSLLIGNNSQGFFRVGSVTTSPSVVGNVLQTTVKVSPNMWYNVIGTHVGGVGLSMYVNGVLIASQTFTGTNLRTSARGWCWGNLASGATNTLRGKMAISYAWERLLTPSEIMQVYLAHKQRFLTN